MEQPSISSKAYNCDCLEYMRSLPDNYFDLAIADPPYGIGASKPSKKPSNILQKNGSIMSASVTDFGKKDWDNNIPTQEFFDELRRVSKNQIIWGANYFGLQGGMIVWDKINGNSDQYDCEIAYQSFNKRTDLVHYMWNGMFQGKYCGRDIRQAAVQQGNKALNEKRIHPTQKPVILYEWLLNNYAKKGDRIFDPMMGSQSSRIAAHRLGFDYVGCELDKEYFEKGCSRFDSEQWSINDLTIVRYNKSGVCHCDEDELSLKHYQNDLQTAEIKAKLAIRERIINSWQRSFTQNQRIDLGYYVGMSSDVIPSELFRQLYEEVIKDPDVARKPEKWQTDTLRELNDLAEGITREQGQGLKLKH